MPLPDTLSKRHGVGAVYHELDIAPSTYYRHQEQRQHPEAYLRHILSVLPEWPSNKVAELLPWNVDLTDK